MIFMRARMNIEEFGNNNNNLTRQDDLIVQKKFLVSKEIFSTNKKIWKGVENIMYRRLVFGVQQQSKGIEK